jgi:predicted ATPase
LLALLLIHANEVVVAEQLIQDLWTAAAPMSAANTLQAHVSHLRKALGPDRILTRASGYLLRVATDDVDALRFERLLDAGRRARAANDPEAAVESLRRALSLWRGAPYADVTFASFAQQEIARLEELRIEALEERIDAELALGADGELVSELERLVAQHPLRERPRAELMLALYRSGRQADALACYQDARRRLVEDLGLEPGDELRRLERAILQHDPGLQSRERPDETPSNVPAPATELVGRQLELAEVCELLRGKARLVTLTGPGGVGKTRLAQEAAHELVGDFPDGIRFVDLSAVEDDGLVAASIARTLEVRPGPKPLLQRLEQSIQGRRLLLVLDNFEHVVDAAPLVGRLLTSSRGLEALVTSRAPLRLSGEHEYALGPLAEEPAAELFCARARAVDRSFEPDEAVAEICRRLDRLPLAIELAAARAKLLSTAEILHRLRRPLPLLTSRTRDRPERQRTLSATIAWSYDLLEPSARRLFQELAVFAGSWTVEAAETVCGATLDELEELLDLSLLGRDRNGRLTMLETIREFARELLAASGRRDELRRRHLSWYVELAERVEPLLTRAEQSAWLDRLEVERDNLRAALATALELEEVDQGLHLASALADFWGARGDLDDARAVVERLLGHPKAASARFRPAGLAALGRFSFHLGFQREAERSFGEALALARSAGDEHLAARCLGQLGNLAGISGRTRRAMRLINQSIAAAEALRDARLVAVGLHQLGHLCRDQGDLDRASELLERCVSVSEATGDRLWSAVNKHSLGDLALDRGEHQRAASLYEEALPAARDVRDERLVAYCLAGLAALAAEQGRPMEAVLLWGVVEALERRTAPLTSFERPRYEKRVEAARRSIGDLAFEQVRARGAALPLDEALAYVQRHELHPELVEIAHAHAS